MERRSDNQGIPVQSPDRCIFCGKHGDDRHPDREFPKLFRIEQKKSWNQFRSCTPYLKDDNMRERISTFIRGCSDPLVAHTVSQELLQDNVRETYSESDSIHIQNVSRDEVKIMFFKHVNKCIFENNEPRLLSGLLAGFNDMLRDF